MCRSTGKIAFIILFSVVVVSSNKVFADYLEGIDTTGSDGYSRDSSFHISIYDLNQLLGNIIVRYYQDGTSGYFNYSFDEVKIVPETPKNAIVDNPTKPPNCCFIVKRKDSTYMKVQILKKISDEHNLYERYVYKFGLNTVPNNRLLEKQDYDRSIKYKPNNTHYSFSWNTLTKNYAGYDTLEWDPPLQNNNHLTGYIIYKAKKNITIDTTAPIDLSQWDSIVIADTSVRKYTADIYPQYYNIVADYAEGKSGFLKGWTCDPYQFTNINLPLSSASYHQSRIIINHSLTGYFLTFLSPLCQSAPVSFSIFDAAGREVSSFSGIAGDPIRINSSGKDLCGGLYVVNAVSGGNVVAKQPFAIVR